MKNMEPLKSCVREYYECTFAFLGFSDQQWEKYFDLAFAHFTDDYAESKKKAMIIMNQCLHDYFCLEIQKGNTLLFANMLQCIYMREKNFFDTFRSFFLLLKRLSVCLDEDFYQRLQKDSLLLRQMLVYFGLQHCSFGQVYDQFLKLMVYRGIKPSCCSLSETKDFIEKLVAVLPLTDQNFFYQELTRFHHSEFFKRMKLLISSKHDFYQIYLLLCQECEEVSWEFYLTTLYYLSLKELVYVLEEYQNNRVFDCDILQRKEYFYFLKNKIDFVSLTFQEKDVGFIRKKKGSCLYDYFLFPHHVLSVEDKNYIDNLFYHMSLERQQGILDYIHGIITQKDRVGKKARNDLTFMQERFRKDILQIQDRSQHIYRSRKL